MKKLKIIYIGLILVSMIYASGAVAANIWVSGKIKKILVDKNYSGCMISLDKNIGGTCPSRWVSLDCKGLFYDKSIETGKKKFAAALAAASAGKTVSVLVNDVNKVNSFCVAQRIDTSY
jgi:hypothetical protein